MKSRRMARNSSDAAVGTGHARDSLSVGAGHARDSLSVGAGHARDSSTPIAIRRSALALLARRDYGIAELRTRLLRKFGNDAPVDAELEQLAADGLLDETRFIEAFVRMHRTRGHGPQRILHELARRGVNAELAEAIVEPHDAQWVDLARRWRERRFGAAVPRASADWQRQARHLQSRGFSTDQVRRALRPADE
jgi:regulatory protein